LDGLSLASLPIRLGVSPNALDSLLSALEPPPVREAGRAYARAVVRELGDRVLAHVREFHGKCCLEPGMPLQLLRSQLAAPAELVDYVLRERSRHGEIEVLGAVARATGWTPSLAGADRARAEELLAELRTGRHEPPSGAELAARFGPRTPDVLRFLERRGDVVEVADGRYYAADALRELVDTLRQRMEAGRAYAPSELRDMLGSSRKYLIPLLEYCDRSGLTRREAQGRVWCAR
jgi:selenocysteine-specific elongation factor